MDPRQGEHQRGQNTWPPVGIFFGRQRAAIWPPTGSISWPPPFGLVALPAVFSCHDQMCAGQWSLDGHV